MLENTLPIDDNDVEDAWERAQKGNILDETQDLANLIPGTTPYQGNELYGQTPELDEEELMFDSPDYNISDSRNNKTSSKKQMNDFIVMETSHYASSIKDGHNKKTSRNDYFDQSPGENLDTSRERHHVQINDEIYELNGEIDALMEQMN